MTAEVVHKDVLDGIREKMDHLYAVQDYYFPDTQAEKQVRPVFDLHNKRLPTLMDFIDSDTGIMQETSEPNSVSDAEHARW